MHGDFCWYELMTTDMPAAATFYSAVISWTARPAHQSPTAYMRFEAGGAPAAGMMTLAEDARGPYSAMLVTSR